jgi:hypothetical protein
MKRRKDPKSVEKVKDGWRAPLEQKTCFTIEGECSDCGASCDEECDPECESWYEDDEDDSA